MLIHNAEVTGSLTINNVPFNSGSFSGSFQGDGSQLTGIASYTDADTLFFIQGYSGSYSGSFFGDGSNLTGVTSYTDADTLDFINSLNVVSGSIQTLSTVSDTFTSVTSYTVTHNFGTKEVIVSVYENDTLIFPSSINTPTTNTVTITFPEPVTGRVVVVKAGHVVSGSINYTSVLNKPTLVSGSSQISFTGITNKPTLISGSSQVSFTGITNKPTLISGSAQITYSGLSGIPVGIVSGSAQIAALGYATTGSNQFKASQVITGSLTVTGAIVAQTLNVQQVTSSVIFSSGSNKFGNSVSNTQQFTGSVNITGSLTTSIATLGTAATTFLTSNNGTIRSRTAAQTLSDIAALPLTGGTLTGALNGTSASFTRANDGGVILRLENTDGNGYSFSRNNITGFLLIQGNQVGDNNICLAPTGGNVGIGNPSPSYRLSVSGNTNSGVFLKQGSQIGDTPSTNFYSALTFENVTTTNAWSIGYSQGAKFSINYFDPDSSTYTRVFTATPTGNIGIGTNVFPTAKLYVGETANNTSGDISTVAQLITPRATIAYPLTVSSAGSGVTNDQIRITYNYGSGFSATAYIASYLENASLAETGLSFGVYKNGLGLHEGMRLTPDKYIRLASSSGGIQFNGDTAAANALDDYEQGTFTPIVQGSTTVGTGTYSRQTGGYTKIGNLVTCNVWVDWSSHTGTGNLVFAGLPFTSIGTTDYRASGTLGWVYNIALTANNVMTIAMSPSTTVLGVGQYPVGGGEATSVPMDSAGNVHYAITYQTT